MPSIISPAMQASLQRDTYTFCVCCKITRKDGVILGFTNHQRDVVIDDVRYRAGSGMTPSALQSRVSVQVDNAEISWIFVEDQISERDAKAGLYEDAEVKFFVADYKKLSAGIIKGPKGEFGRFMVSDNGSCTIEFRSLSQRASQDIGDETCLTCRVRKLGTGLCKFNLSGNTLDGFKARNNGWVTIVGDKRSFFSNLNNTYATPYSNSQLYVWDTVTWGRSLNKKFDYRILPVDSFDGDRFLLEINPNITKKMLVGDTGVAHAIKVSDATVHTFNFTVNAFRQEASDAYSVQVNSDFWGAPPVNAAGSFPAQFFRNGILTWTTGKNKGISIEVLSHDTQAMTLQEQCPFDIEVGDAFVVEVGCDRTLTMCWQRFGQAVNFDGEPFILPIEEVTKIDKKK